MALWLGFGWGGPDGIRIVEALGFAPFAVYATVCTILAARSAQGRTRAAWTLMAVGLASWAIGDLTWTFFESVLLTTPFPSPADVFYILSPVLIAIGIVQFPREQSDRSRLRMLIDGLIVAVALLLLIWALFHDQITPDNPDLLLSTVLAMIYPALDAVVVAVTVTVLIGARPGQRAALWLLTAAVAVMAASDTVFAHLVVTDRYLEGMVTDVGWPLALTLFGASALVSRHSHRTSIAAEGVPPWTSLWVPYLPLLIAGVLGPPLVLTGLLRVGVPLLMALVVARQVMSAWENRQLVAAAAEKALRDPLTGLANRTLFHNRLDHTLRLRSRDDRSVAVASLDLDDFKLVNDSLGHATADALLVAVGQRLAEHARPGDTVARLGGDEFALLLEGDVDESHLLVQHVGEAFAEPFVIDGQDLVVRPSIGMAVASPNEPTLAPETMIDRAEIAMRTAKRSRSAQVQTFSTDMVLGDLDAAADRVHHTNGGAAQVRLLGELRDAIEHHALGVVYQPKIDLPTGRVVGVEALLRWPHPHLGTLRPDTFLPLVRQHGLMRPVTDLVVDTVLTDAADWAAHGIHLPVAINLFAPLLRDPHLPDALCQTLHAHGVPPDQLTVEITEDLALSEVNIATAVLRQLRHRGIRVAIDDFGSGYSALSYLRDLPIDEIKLDRNFIADVTNDATAAAVVGAVIDLTHTLGITVVAEGIEDAHTAAWLTQHHCDTAQGYHFGKPTTATSITKLVTAETAKYVRTRDTS